MASARGVAQDDVTSAELCQAQSLPTERLKKLTVCLGNLAERDDAHESPDGSNSDSGDSLFITQKPVPEAVRPKRRRGSRTPSKRRSGDLPELEDEITSQSASSGEESRVPKAKRRKGDFKLPKFNFPFLRLREESKHALLSHENRRLHNYSMAGFFKSVREHKEGKSGHLRTIGRGNEPFYTARQIRKKADIYAVDAKLFVTSITPRYGRRMTLWSSRQRQAVAESLRDAQNSETTTRAFTSRTEEDRLKRTGSTYCELQSQDLFQEPFVEDELEDDATTRTDEIMEDAKVRRSEELRITVEEEDSCHPECDSEEGSVQIDDEVKPGEGEKIQTSRKREIQRAAEFATDLNDDVCDDECTEKRTEGVKRGGEEEEASENQTFPEDDVGLFQERRRPDPEANQETRDTSDAIDNADTQKAKMKRKKRRKEMDKEEFHVPDVDAAAAAAGPEESETLKPRSEEEQRSGGSIKGAEENPGSEETSVEAFGNEKKRKTSQKKRRESDCRDDPVTEAEADSRTVQIKKKMKRRASVSNEDHVVETEVDFPDDLSLGDGLSPTVQRKKKKKSRASVSNEDCVVEAEVDFSNVLSLGEGLSPTVQKKKEKKKRRASASHDDCEKRRGSACRDDPVTEAEADGRTVQKKKKKKRRASASHDDCVVEAEVDFSHDLSRAESSSPMTKKKKKKKKKSSKEREKSTCAPEDGEIQEPPSERKKKKRRERAESDASALGDLSKAEQEKNTRTTSPAGDSQEEHADPGRPEPSMDGYVTEEKSGKEKKRKKGSAVELSGQRDAEKEPRVRPDSSPETSDVKKKRKRKREERFEDQGDGEVLQNESREKKKKKKKKKRRKDETTEVEKADVEVSAPNGCSCSSPPERSEAAKLHFSFPAAVEEEHGLESEELSRKKELLTALNLSPIGTGRGGERASADSCRTDLSRSFMPAISASAKKQKSSKRRKAANADSGSRDEPPGFNQLIMF